MFNLKTKHENAKKFILLQMKRLEMDGKIPARKTFSRFAWKMLTDAFKLEGIHEVYDTASWKCLVKLFFGFLTNPHGE